MKLGYAELLGVFAGGCSAALVLLRAISLHEFDMLLYRRRRFLGFRPINRFLEPFFPSL
ncbi:MAG: hypothetical protein H7144_18575, partial [Burkholderiales bacterium]|nr:hypothetical protein [Phycisphaerae bacterium]